MIGANVALGITTVVLVAVAVTGVVAVRGRVDGLESYISARDSAGPGTLVATIIASSMGAWILFSPAEAAAGFGGIAAVLGYAVGSALPLAVYAGLGRRIRALVPRGHSLTEYALIRYGRAMYAYVLVVSVAYMFVFLAAEMTGIASVLSLVAGVPGWQTAALVGGTVLLYTAYGGLQVSMVTDALQTLLILPLLVVGFAAAVLVLGGPVTIYEGVRAADPTLLDPTFGAGLEFGLYVVVAILGAELLNQAWWQRIYAARDGPTLTRSFLIASVAVVPMVLLMGVFGLAAVGIGLPEGDASVALFYVVTEAFPTPVVLAIVVLAVLLVASSADTLFNAIASVVTADLPRIVDLDDAALTTAARALTVVVALAATVVGAQGYSVLAVFLTADLLAAATFVPLLTGLYTGRLGGTGALLASVLGLIVGVAGFPLARPLLPAAIAGELPEPSFLVAFAGAAGAAGLGTVLATLLPGERFDFGRLMGAGVSGPDGDTAADGGEHQ